MNNFKKCNFIFLIILFTFVFGTSVLAYNDLSQNHWAYTAVEAMRLKDILHGYPDGNFYPEKNVTREEFAKIVVNTLELTQKEVDIQYEDIEDSRWSKEFIDVGGKYFTAYKMGDKYFFKPEEDSLREDVIVTTVLALNLENEEYDLDILNQFSDRDTITPSLEKYLAIAVQNDLIHGNTDGTLNPQGKLTRAEVSQFMYNILVKLENGELIKIPVIEEIGENLVPELTADIKDGAKLTYYSEIKLSAKNTQNLNFNIGDLSCSVEYDGSNVYSNSFVDGDVIKVANIIREADRYDKNLYDREVKLKLYFDNMAEGKFEHLTEYNFVISDTGRIKLSLDKEENSTLKHDDVLKFTSENYNGEFHCWVLVKEDDDDGFFGSYQKDMYEEDRIEISEVVDHYKNQEGIDLAGKEIMISIYSKDYGEYTNIATLSIKYKMKGSVDEGGVPELTANIKNGAKLTYYSEIKLSAKNTQNLNFNIGDLSCSVEYDGINVYSNSFVDGDVIKVADIIKEADRYDKNLYGREVKLKLYFDNMPEGKFEHLTEYNFVISDTGRIKLSLDKEENSTLKQDDVLKFTSENYNGEFHCWVLVKEDDDGFFGSYQKDMYEEDRIDISEVVDHYKNQEGIDLAGKEIMISIYSKDYGEYTNIAVLRVKYRIEAPQVAVTSVNIGYSNLTMSLARPHTFEAKVTPSNATNKTITWTSSNPKVATVDEEGNVVPNGVGKTTITATSSNGKKSSCLLTIYTLKYESTIFEVGESECIAHGVEKLKDFKSSNTKVATVDQKGVVTALSGGEAIITCRDNNNTEIKCIITVKDENAPVEPIVFKMTPDKTEFEVTETINLSVKSGTLQGSEAIIWEFEIDGTEIATNSGYSMKVSKIIDIGSKRYKGELYNREITLKAFPRDVRDNSDRETTVFKFMILEPVVLELTSGKTTFTDTDVINIGIKSGSLMKSEAIVWEFELDDIIIATNSGYKMDVSLLQKIAGYRYDGDLYDKEITLRAWPRDVRDNSDRDINEFKIKIIKK